MLPGLLRFVFLLVFVFVAACAGDAAPPMVVTNNDIRPEQDAALPDVSGAHDTDPSETDVEILEDVEITDDTESIDDTEIPEDTDPPEPPCAAHTDCVGEELCIPNADNGDLTCIVPTDCETDAQCDAPKICAFDYHLDTLRTVCLEPVGPGEIGEFCADDAECASNLCLNEQCATTCKRHDDCSNDGSFLCTPQEIEHAGMSETINVCTPKPATQCASDTDCSGSERCIIRSSADDAKFVCALPPPGGLDPGAACTINADCASNLCLGNVCMSPCAGDYQCDVDAGYTCDNVQVTHNGNPATVSICQPPVECERNGQCELDEVCYIRKTTSEVQTHCKSPNVGGAKDVGATCTTDESCASNLCLQGRFRKHCAPACTTDAHCAAPGSPVQYECKSVTLELTNGSDTVKTCVAKAPSSCTSQANCAAGTQCAVVTNAANNGLETVCIPVTGGRTSGNACSTHDQCNGQLCLNNTCSQPCTARDQCGPEQLCRNNNVQKSGFSKSIQVCETPPRVRCTSNLDCTDGVRICSEYKLINGTTSEGYCNFPNPGGASTGTDCSLNNECQSDLCFFVTNQCSMLCTNNGQCGGNGQICTTYAGSGMCASSCNNNDACSSGQSCTVNLNINTSSFDYVCQSHSGAGQLGFEATTPGDCQSGLVVSRGSGPTYCSIICDPGNGNNDCSGGVPGNQLTACESITLSDGGNVTQDIWACAMP